jgi:hypothetical protein
MSKRPRKTRERWKTSASSRGLGIGALSLHQLPLFIRRKSRGVTFSAFGADQIGHLQRIIVIAAMIILLAELHPDLPVAAGRIHRYPLHIVILDT